MNWQETTQFVQQLCKLRNPICTYDRSEDGYLRFAVALLQTPRRLPWVIGCEQWVDVYEGLTLNRLWQRSRKDKTNQTEVVDNRTYWLVLRSDITKTAKFHLVFNDL